MIKNFNLTKYYHLKVRILEKFENIHNEFLHPFHIVADIEITLEEVKNKEDNNTQKYQKHVANSFRLK